MEDNKNDFLLIIDGSSLLSTQFYGNLPREILFAKTNEEKEKYYYKIMQTSKGIYTNAVYGFVRTLLRILKEQKPKYLAVAWDISRDTFRRELYPEYKGNRGETAVPLKEQFVLCQKLLDRMNIRQFMDERYEADDFSGTLSKRFEQDIPIRIMTKDNDYLQLVSDRTNLWMIHSTAKKTEELYKKYAGKTNPSEAPDRCFTFNTELVKLEFGIEPASVSSLKGLQGDSSDNIKGVPGIGETSALALIKEYGTVEKLYDTINSLDNAGINELNEYWKNNLGLKRSPMAYLRKESEEELVGERAARLSKQLATIKCDIDLGDLSLAQLRVNIDLKASAAAFEELEFKSLSLDYDESAEVIFNDKNYSTISELSAFQHLCEIIDKEQGDIGISVVADEAEKRLYGIAFSSSEVEGTLVRVNNEINEGRLKDYIKKLIRERKSIVVNDLKQVLNYIDFQEEDMVFDTAVAAYLLNPLAADYGYSYLASAYLDTRIPTQSELQGKRSITELIENDISCLQRIYCYNAAVSCKTASVLRTGLEETGMKKLYDEIEHPLIFTLYDMETRGIRVDKAALRDYGDKLKVGIDILEKEIYELAGEEFNISSPKQLGVILFEKLKLPYGKKTKSGYSTSADVLEKLAAEDPIVNKVLEYRQLTKLKSTYADGLAEYISSDGRIHSKFNQMITATGRISSTEPNLQNIPVRVELGRLIRKVFIPEEDYEFLNADYSQIELRILAHMSADRKLIEAYRSAEDIHRITASEVFKTPLEEVTSEQRSNAKAVNFGIVYGISSFGLGQGLNISRKEAESYINKYFVTYPKIKAFLDGLVSSARENGYAVTEYGRRRPIPELESTNFMQRSFGERIAMNSPIQGTAADIIKIAMVRVNRALKTAGLKSRLILQIHDELLIEVYKGELDRVRDILTDTMKHAAKLEVELDVDSNTGMTWYDLK